MGSERGGVRRRIKHQAKADAFRHPRLSLMLALFVAAANLIIYAVSYLTPASHEALSMTGARPITELLAVYFVKTPVGYIVALLLILLELLLLAPLEQGAFEVFLNVAARRQPTLKTVGRWFSFPRSLSALMLHALLRVVGAVFYLLFCALPVVAILWWEDLHAPMTATGSEVQMIYLWLAIALVVTMVLATAWVGRYSMSRYILAADEKRGAFDTIRRSSREMRRYVWDYFIFRLSFLPWLVLGVISFGISLIHTIPYYIAAEARFYLYIDTRDLLRLTRPEPPEERPPEEPE